MSNELFLESVDDILLNLKIIANIKENDKISTHTPALTIDGSSIFQCLKRWFYNNSREDTLEKIDKVIKRSFEITDATLENEVLKSQKLQHPHPSTDEDFFKEDNSNIFQRFVVEMSNACKGLENMKLTYKDDISTQSKLDIMIHKLKMRVDKINKILKIQIHPKQD